MGNEVPVFFTDGKANLERKLLVLRLQASHLHSSGADIGSVLFADTFYQLDVTQGNPDTTLNLTKNVPSLQLWQTTHKHYENLPVPIMTEKNLSCPELGDRLNYYQDLQGFIPLKASLREFLPNQDIYPLVSVKAVFYERGIIL